MTERTRLSQYYREGRERLTALVRDHLDEADTPVPATPGWTVHDVVAHLTGVAQDIASGTVPKQGPTAQWTSGHVQRGAGVSTEGLLESWSTLSADTERVVDTYSVWPAVMDVVCHEHDVRGALGDAGGRDNEFIAVAAKVIARLAESVAAAGDRNREQAISRRPGGRGADHAADHLVGSVSLALRPAQPRAARCHGLVWRCGADPGRVVHLRAGRRRRHRIRLQTKEPPAPGKGDGPVRNSVIHAVSPRVAPPGWRLRRVASLGEEPHRTRLRPGHVVQVARVERATLGVQRVAGVLHEPEIDVTPRRLCQAPTRTMTLPETSPVAAFA